MSYRAYEYIQKAIRSAEEAVADDTAQNFEAAMHQYINAAEWFMEALKYGVINWRMKQQIQEKIEEYLNRAEQIKEALNRDSIKKKTVADSAYELTNSSDNRGLSGSLICQTPSTWEKSTTQEIRFILRSTTSEYKSIVSNFDETMNGKYARIIRIERIQNERCYMQYLVHHADFQKRLKMDAERSLYHGCSDQAANSIIETGFNRSFAGKNGIFYGSGVYFSENAEYSHRYAIPNGYGIQCMFVARVLIGETTLGNPSMKTPPPGFDSTTDNDHIFVTYNDAQAFAEYLITYK